VFEEEMVEIMDRKNVSQKDENISTPRSHISGTPTIAELRRRVWVRAHPKEQTNKAGKKTRASK
jgi:hypothetical protein